jgi:hypothetical protein
VESTGQDLFPNKMKSDDFRSLSLVKMAMDGVTDIAAKLFQRVCFRKNRMPESASRKAAFRGILHQEYEFVHFGMGQKSL